MHYYEAQSTCFVITASRQASCVHFIAKLWSDYNVNYDDINRSTHPDEQYCCVNSTTNHALRTPAVSTETGATDALIVINVRA